MFDRVLAGLLILALGCTSPFAQADTSLPAWEGPPEHFTPHTADTTTLSGALAPQTPWPSWGWPECLRVRKPL